VLLLGGLDKPLFPLSDAERLAVLYPTWLLPIGYIRFCPEWPRVKRRIARNDSTDRR